MKNLIQKVCLVAALGAVSGQSHAQLAEAADPGSPGQRQVLAGCHSTEQAQALRDEFAPAGARHMPEGCRLIQPDEIAERYIDGGSAARMVRLNDGTILHLDNTPTTDEARARDAANVLGPERALLFERPKPSRQDEINAWEAAHPGPDGPAFMPGLSMEEKMCVVADRLNKQAKAIGYDDGHMYDCHGSEDERASLRNTVQLEERDATP